MENVILVNERDEELGLMEKMEAHRKGLLHRAFSVLIFNSDGELLLQQRALNKYHSPGLWTNTCCSHPRAGESITVAAERRLKEEMGIICKPEVTGSFIYKAAFGNGLTEHEYDYVLKGVSDQAPVINMDEVHDYIYRKPVEVIADLKVNPDRYTIWFHKLAEAGFLNP